MVKEKCKVDMEQMGDLDAYKLRHNFGHLMLSLLVICPPSLSLHLARTGVAHDVTEFFSVEAINNTFTPVDVNHMVHMPSDKH